MLRIVFPVSRYEGLQSLVSESFKEARYLVFVEVADEGSINESSYVYLKEYESPASVVRRKGGNIVICDLIDDFNKAYLLVLGIEVIQGFKGTIKEGLEKYLRGELVPSFPEYREGEV
ncbi:MAG: NifB/NifX family molybdenum-iron cluster-binding protein [Desulfurococcaceae archaeon TW002]